MHVNGIYNIKDILKYEKQVHTDIIAYNKESIYLTIHKRGGIVANIRFDRFLDGFKMNFKLMDNVMSGKYAVYVMLEKGFKIYFPESITYKFNGLGLYCEVSNHDKGINVLTSRVYSTNIDECNFGSFEYNETNKSITSILTTSNGEVSKITFQKENGHLVIENKLNLRERDAFKILTSLRHKFYSVEGEPISNLHSLSEASDHLDYREVVNVQ